MPELPEVETARRRADRALRGQRIVAVSVVADPIVYEGVSPARFAASLRGRRVLGVHRKGKHLWMELDRPPFPLFHFGMTGSFEIYRDVAARPRFWKVEIEAEDGTRLAMPDPRRLGRLRLRRDPEAEAPLAALGFDVLRDLPPARELAAALARRGAPVKAVLLDQSLFAGVGNWIADEALYQAAIDPRRRASSLAPAEVARLRSRLRAIVRHAVAVGADDRRYPRTWLFHHRWGRAEGARTARGEPIAFATIGGRTTAYVDARKAGRPIRGSLKRRLVVSGEP
jgi:formamidopyrimidine-DNA glycosylase